MTSDQRKKLSEIKQFKQLIAYLRDEMGWPIKSDSDFEELTYEYTATELGIDDKSAAQIQEIKRLRPLSAKQPWGVFFVKFEPKKLPVVALRRILGQVALKKRASANPADRTMWAQEDLLFISNYGKGDDRQITLAHFSVPTGGHTLPSLKVLGWDSKDTVLHLEAVARELTEQLSWPDDESDVDGWRAKWRAAFTVGHQEVITTSKALSIRLAQLARDIRDRISTALTIETEDGTLTKLMKAFQESLIHDLTSDDFADMYAQTIAYGLLSSRIADPQKKSVDDLATHMRLSPFLKELMETFLQVGGRNKRAGLDFDELGVGEVIDLLDQANMEAVVADFGDRNPEEDPIIHFYELFLKEYDARKRMSRGVFYTPRPVVSYIVRSVDELLRTSFGLADGLADTASWGEMLKSNKDLKIPEGVSPDQDFIQILDPATGTGTFLVEVIDVVYKTLHKKWSAQGKDNESIKELWNAYVPKHLLTRLHGYELLMAPYAIAHLKISVKLQETGYNFHESGRIRVFLTNSLLPAEDISGTLRLTIPALSHEAESVNAVKSHSQFTVVVGNPPYSLQSQNLSEESRALVAPYRFVGQERIRERGALQFEKIIQDDYVKFVRLAQTIMDSTSHGIVGYITNHGWLENRALRGMRSSLLETFSGMRVLDLHGNSRKGEYDASGGTDENVFDIEQGVAITLALRNTSQIVQRVVREDLFGTRLNKYAYLGSERVGILGGSELLPVAPNYTLKSNSTSADEHYETWPLISECFEIGSMGVVTARDHISIDFEPGTLLERAKMFANLTIDDAQLQTQLSLDAKKGWDLSEARKALAKESKLEKFVKPILYRAMDQRNVFYHPSLVWGMSRPTMKNMVDQDNIGITVARNATLDRHGHSTFTALATKTLIGHHVSGIGPVNYLFPLWQGPSKHEGLFAQERTANLDVSKFQSSVKASVSAQECFNYVYGILWSDTYRDRYKQELLLDFPRIPLPKSADLLRALSTLGAELVSLHSFSRLTAQLANQATLSPTYLVENVHFRDGAIFLNKSETTKLATVNETVWKYQVGGYQVCKKWLEDRRGRELTLEEIAFFHGMVSNILETIRISKLADEVIDQHGGWPDAFHSSSDNSEVV